MGRFLATSTAILMTLLPAIADAQTVDMNSHAYKTGHVVGQIFAAIIIFLIIRKVLTSRK